MFRRETGADFVSPAGRVRDWRRAAPTAFVVAAVGRQLAEGVAGPQRVVYESSLICTNLIQIREIRVNSWTVTSAGAIWR